VFVGVCIVDGHVFEIPFDVGVEEAFDFAIVVFRVDEDGTNESLNNVWETFWGLFSMDPEVRGAFFCGLAGTDGVFLGFQTGFGDFDNVVLDLLLRGGAEEEEVFVETEGDAKSTKVLIGHHGHFMFGQPLGIAGGKAVE